MEMRQPANRRSVRIHVLVNFPRPGPAFGEATGGDSRKAGRQPLATLRNRTVPWRAGAGVDGNAARQGELRKNVNRYLSLLSPLN